MKDMNNRNPERSSLLLIYTGGTIGMKADPVDMTLKPFNFSQILEEVPELGKFAYKIDSVTLDPIIDSSDVEPLIWQRIAGIIEDGYDQYDGFIVLHGTDTMAYSASMISFMLENLTKPVIFTGSQLPIGAPRTDGKENLIAAVEIAAAKDSHGHALVPEVCIYFDTLLMRGNRTTKESSDNFRAFISNDYPPLAEAGISIKYNTSLIRYPESWDKPLKVHKKLDTRVSILKIHPGITPQVVRDILCGCGTRAVIMETYGSGNAPSKKWFIDIIKESIESGKIILNVTQCSSGCVDMDIYSNGKVLKDAGIISGHDITTAGALAKLFHILGNNDNKEDITSLISSNLRGEIS